MNLLHRIIFKRIKFPMFETTEKEKMALRHCKAVLDLGNRLDLEDKHHGEFYLCLILYRMATLGDTSHAVAVNLKRKIDAALGNMANRTLELYLSRNSFIFYCFGNSINRRELRKEWIRQLLLYKK